MKIAAFTLAAVGALMPLVSQAATFEYVNTSGDIRAITAADEASALVLATDIAAHSGVMHVADVDESIPLTVDDSLMNSTEETLSSEQDQAGM